MNVMLLSVAQLARALSIPHRTVTVWHVKHVINHSSLIKIQPHTPPRTPQQEAAGCQHVLQLTSSREAPAVIHITDIRFNPTSYITATLFQYISSTAPSVVLIDH